MSENIASIFQNIYEKNSWTNGSGPGSISQLNLELFDFIENLRKTEDLKSMVDLGCGDFQLFRKFEFNQNFSYIGYDVVSDLIEKNNKTFSSNFMKFCIMPSDLADIPETDLVVIKDVLIHLDNATSKKIINRSIEISKFIIFVNNISKGATDYNMDIGIGEFRPVDVSLWPFGLNVIERVEYGSEWAYDPKLPLWLAKIFGKKVWPGAKHIQLVRGGR
ncbi:hypothetical protein GVM20_00470 [Porphyrobacter sp. SLTP]|uniref:hypothetical protein n=1 Tax=Porphyrobacter sp. SLTP TaxID=2683266 RepID=UPI001413205D|nr:hypothetical protein [Porphyrobacter sp. SLTP]NBB23596.1 hypothetical protein [Porphyrobacter sp. SLTP]